MSGGENLTLWVGNIPEAHATEAALMGALRQALVAEGEIDAGGDTGCTKCTVRVKSDKTNGSWALLDFRDEDAMGMVLVLKITLEGVDGEPVVLDIKQAQIKERLAKSKRRLARKQSYGTGALQGVVEQHVQEKPKLDSLAEDSTVRTQNQSLWIGGIPLSLASEEKLSKICEDAGMIGVILCSVRVKPDKKNGSWAMLGFQDAATMQAASKIPVVVKDEEGDEVSLRIKLPSGEQKLEVGAWVGSIPLQYATEKALRAELLAQGMSVKSCTIRVKAEKTNGSWALLTFADAEASNKFFAAARTGEAVTLPGDTGRRVALRMQEFRREKARTTEASALIQMHVMMLQGKVASATDSNANQVPDLVQGKTHHFYLCGHRGSGEAQCLELCMELRQLGFLVVYNSEHGNLEALRQRVIGSMCLLIFLSGRKEHDGHEDPSGDYEGTFTQAYCHEEMSAAYNAGLRCVRVVETETDHGQPSFAHERSRALHGPVHRDAKRNVELLAEDYYIPFRRKTHERAAMIAEIARQLRSAPILQAIEPEPETWSEPEPEPEDCTEVRVLAGQLQNMKISNTRSQDLSEVLVTEGYYDSDVVCDLDPEQLRDLGFKRGEVDAVKRFKRNQLEAIGKLKVQMSGKVGNLRKGRAETALTVLGAQAAAQVQSAAEEGVPPEMPREGGADDVESGDNAESNHAQGQAMTLLRQELEQMKLMALQKRAEAEGVPEGEIETAMDSEEPKSALVKLLIAEVGAAAAPEQRRRIKEELSEMRLTELQKRAGSAGIPEASVEEAINSSDPKSALVELLLAQTTVTIVKSHGQSVTTMQPDQHFDFVFSNKTESDALCLEIHASLTSRGVRVWQQKTNIPKDSDNWFNEWFPSAVKSRKIVCFLTVQYVMSPYCMKEFGIALNSNKLLVVACDPLEEITSVDPSTYPHASNALGYLMGGGQVIFHEREDVVAEILKFA